MMELQIDGISPYKHIERNDFVYRKHMKQKVEDIAVCICDYDSNDPDSACGERCLNVLTSTECTPGYCPCEAYCKNQRFQKCEYAMVKLFKTDGRGWGLLASENIKRGQFVIEYCGEIISWKEAKRRSQVYEAEGLKDAYTIFLNANESIDATRKGSLARFINHSCQSNCETRKWNVLGEVRVGIFAKQDIPAGTELSYDYNFEWFGGTMVRCLCGATSCSGFLGAKSRGFQEANYLWEDDDNRYSVEKIPLYDSEEDGPTSVFKVNDPLEDIEMMAGEQNQFSSINAHDTGGDLDASAISVEPLNFIPAGGVITNGTNIDGSNDKGLYTKGNQQTFMHKNAMISRIKSNSACRNYHIESSPLPKRAARYPSGRSKNSLQKQMDFKHVAQRLASKEAQDELLVLEQHYHLATSQLDSLYNDIRPAIEEHERDSQDSVPTNAAEKWIEASCCKIKAEFDLYSSIIKNITFPPRQSPDAPLKIDDNGDRIKYLEMG